MIKSLAVAVAGGLTCFLLMGNTGCQQNAGHVQTGMGTTYTGLGPPVVTTAGTWVHTGGSGAHSHWAFLAAASGAVASAALAQAVNNSRFVIEHTNGNVTHVSWTDDPCSNKPGSHQLSQWYTPLQHLKANLNCAGLRNILSRNSKTGGRLRNIYNCIGGIIRNGSYKLTSGGQAWVFTHGTGSVTVTRSGNILLAHPNNGDWRKCAAAGR